MVMPANVGTGRVEGRFIVGVADGPDVDDEPDAIAAQGTITFTASVPYLPNPTSSPSPSTLLKVPIVSVLDDEGYLCTPDPTDPTKAGTRGIRLVATDDPDLSVQEWTWTVTYSFQTVNGVRPQIASHSIALPTGATVDLTSVVKVPSSTGIGTEQAEALAAAAAAAASRAEAAATAAAAATLPHTSVVEHGAKGDGVTDDTAAVQAALVAGAGGNVYFAPGAYRLTENLSVPAGTTITGAGSEATRLDWSGVAGWNGPGFLSWEGGTLTDPSPLTTDATLGDPAVTVSDGHAFKAGDHIRVTVDEVAFGEAVKAEFQRVRVVNGNTLTLSGPMFDTYSVAGGAKAELANFTGGAIGGVTIRGKGINPDGYGDNALTFTLAKDVHITDVRFEDVENRCIYLASTLGANINDCHFRFDPSHTALQYGIAINGASQLISIHGCSSWNDRHLVTTSTSPVLSEAASPGRGVPRLITVTGCTAHGSWQCPIDTHRGGEYLTVTGNSLTTELTGVKSRGSHTIISGNVIVGKGVAAELGAPVGVRIGMRCEDVQVTANIIRGFDSGVRIDTPDSASNRGMVISENSILDCVQGVYVGGTTPYNDIRIAGNMIRPTSAGFGIYLIATIRGLEVSGNTFVGGNTGVYCASAARSLSNVTIQANTFRDATARAMWLLNIDTGLVASNFAPLLDIRFHGESPNVSAALNIAASITDTSTPGVVQV